MLCILKFFFVLHQHNKFVKRGRTDIFHICMFVGTDHVVVPDHCGRCIFVYHTQSVYNMLCILKFFGFVHQHNKFVKRGCADIFHIFVVVGPYHCGRCILGYHTQSVYNMQSDLISFDTVHQHNKLGSGDDMHSVHNK